MLTQVHGQLFKARVNLEFRAGCPYRVKAGAKVAGRPLGLIPYHQAEELQSLFREPAAKRGIMKTMHQVVGMGRWLQPARAAAQGFGERILCRYAKAAEAFGDGG
jgi:hypothetical protein